MTTYGNLKFNAELKKWEITDLPPHVAIAFKRLFTRVPQTASVIHLTDSDETRADLQWFMQRYPLEHRFAKAIAAGSKRIAYRMAERNNILLPTWEPADAPAFRGDLKPYKYQSQAAQICLNNRALLLGDDVGLGKTVSAIATGAMGAPLPIAIVVQPHLASQWAKQVNRFTNLRVHVIRGTKPYDLPRADIYVFRYSNLAGWSDVIDKGIFRTVIWDEIQELRHGNETAKGIVSMSLQQHAEVKMGLTATPVYNYGDEMHKVMEFIAPDVLGDRYEFIREWCGGTNKVKDPDALGSYLRDTGYYLRRKEDDPTVDAALPPPNILDFEVECDQRAVDDEQSIIKMLAMQVLKGNFAESGKAARELDIKLRMLTGVGKARAVAAYVRMLLEDGERVLLAGWHREVYSIWREALGKYNPVLYTGSETSAAKDRNVQWFCEGYSRVMFISLRSGAGLDGLQQHCNEVVIGELDWSPQVHKQIIGRLRRPGQTKQVNVHYLHTRWGSDPVLMDMLAVKADQARGINDPGVAPAAKFSDDSRIKRLAEYVLETR